ncbi:MAG TPA: D-glucuronyl C5-epimerase family protein [Thermoleophilaceae bacterium]
MSETPLHMMRGNRALPAPLERALNAALSRGPGYEPTPIGPDFDDTSVRGYYIDFRAKTTSPVAGDAASLPAIQLIQLALGWWERYVAGEPAARDRFLELCSAVEERSVTEGAERLWPVNVAVPKYGLAPGWFSALPQGQAASVFVRAHLASGEERYAELARGAIEPFLSHGRSSLVSPGAILEEAPSTPASHILNGWMSALWGVWDVQLGLADSRARDLLGASVDRLRRSLSEYDTGWWTLYSLYPHPVADLAKPIYHRFHVTQLEVYHRLTGYAEFAETRTRWAGYDRPARRVRAVAQKAGFAVVESRRRRRWERSHAAG